MLTANVSAVPFNSIGAVLALKEENCAESPMTANPHRHITDRNIMGERLKRIGEVKHRIPESVRNP